MKINKSKLTTKRKLLYLVSALTIIGVVFLSYIWLNHTNDNNDTSSKTTDYSGATVDQKQNGADIKSSNASNSTSPNQSTTPSTTPDSTQKNISISITAANQNGSTLQIRALIENVVNNGTCTLTMSKSGQKTFTKTVGVQALASSSTCQGFDVSISDLSTGSWHATIKYIDGSLSGETEQDIIIK